MTRGAIGLAVIGCVAAFGCSDDADPDECTPSAEVCDDADNDCDGTVDNLTTLADVQDGVCAGATKVCVAGAPAEPDYSAVPGYEATEVTCDDADNDCDGAVDNGLVRTGESAGCAVSSCEELARLRPGGSSGSYWIDPTGEGAVQVTCDLTTELGGWTVMFDVCDDDTASLEQPLDPDLAALPVGLIHVTTVGGESRVVRWLETAQQTVADLYAEPFTVPTAGVAYRTKRLGDGLDLFDDGDCPASGGGAVMCTNLFAATNVMSSQYGHDYGCRDAATCVGLETTDSRYLELVCKLMVRSIDFAALAPETTCLAHRDAGHAHDGVYTIDPDGAGAGAPFEVWCDMTTDGGGWTLITAIDANAEVTSVDAATLITPHTSNVTNRSMMLPGASEVLLVNDGRDDGWQTSYDKAEKLTSVTGLSLSWTDLIGAFNANAGGAWDDLAYSTGADDPWQFTVERVNDQGCLQTPLRGSYGDGNYGGFNGAGYAPPGGLYFHWGQEVWMVGVYGNLGPTLFDYAFSDLRCDAELRPFARFWHGTFLR